MANVEQKAEFINIGGASIPGIGGTGGTGNVLVDTLAQFPALMKTFNTENKDLNGRPVTEEVKYEEFMILRLVLYQETQN